MIKIGDKLLFDKYIPYNYMNSSKLTKTLLNKSRLNARSIVLDRSSEITIYKERLIHEDQKLSGIFIGEFRKKLNRSYRRVVEPVVTFEERLREVRRNPTVTAIDDYMLSRVRPSKNPRRLDDPRQLDKMAMMRVGRKMIAVPMSNIVHCNFADKFRVL
jgi:hypothetical protein